MDVKGILYAIAAFILYLIFAIIYFIILSFIIKVGVGLVLDGMTANALAIAAAILTAGTIIAGGGIGTKFE
jgi:hypothetical protein